MWNKIMIIYRISSLLRVIIYGLFVYFVIYLFIARENILLTYLLNIVMIILGLHLDKVARRFADKSAPTIRKELFSERGTVFARIARVLYTVSLGFFRTTMYQFYMIATVLAVVTTHLYDFLPFELSNFFSSIEYGILLLLVFDNIKVLTAKDSTWFRQHIGLDLQREDSERDDDSAL